MVKIARFAAVSSSRMRPAAAGLIVGLAVAAFAVPAAGAAGGQLYWANISSNTIGKANLDGTHVDQTFVKGANGPSDVVVYDQHIYWANASGCTESGSCNGSIARSNLNGTGVNESFIPTDTAYGVAVYGNSIYWSNFGTGTVGRANLNGTHVNQSFITGASSPDGVVVDGRYIYWSNNGSGTIGRANLDGSGVNQSFITGASSPEGIAINGQHIYWVNHNSASIGRATLAGTGVDQTFVKNAGAWPTRVAVGALHIYWTTWAQNAVPSTGTLGEASLNGTGVKNNLIYSAESPVGVAVSG